MNKTKTMLTGFAVFASILLLSATCIAGTVQGKAVAEVIEYKEQYFSKLFLMDYLDDSYFSDVQNIVVNFDENLELPTGSDLLYSDSPQAQWGGFLRNMNGEIYIPGTGWVMPDEFWLAIEEFLKVIPLAYTLVILEQIEENGPEPTPIIIISLIILYFIVVIAILVIELLIVVGQEIFSAIANLFEKLRQIFGNIVYIWVISILQLLDELLYLIQYLWRLIFPNVAFLGLLQDQILLNQQTYQTLIETTQQNSPTNN